MKKVIPILLAVAICIGILIVGVTRTDNNELSKASAEQALTEPPTEPPTQAPTEPPHIEELAQRKLDRIFSKKLGSKKASVKVEELYQYPELPAGCEAVAVTIALNHYGCGLSKTEFVDRYMIYGSDLVTSYVGDPRVFGGAGIYPPGMVKSVENYVKKTDAKLIPFDTTDRKMIELYKLVDNGMPVVVWTTMYMNYPDPVEHRATYQGHTYSFIDNEHCVTLYGYNLDADEVSISDPQRGKITVSASRFEELYDLTGRCSMTIMDTSNLRKEYQTQQLAPIKKAMKAITAREAAAPTEPAATVAENKKKEEDKP